MAGERLTVFLLLIVVVALLLGGGACIRTEYWPIGLLLWAGMVYVFRIAVTVDKQIDEKPPVPSPPIKNTVDPMIAAVYERLLVPHVKVLKRKKAQLIYMDEWGRLFTDAWDRELVSYINTVFWTMLTPAEQRVFGHYPVQEMLTKEIETRIANTPETPGIAFASDMDPLGYEKLCAERLAAAGWAVRTTKGSGDQGVDVIGDADGMRVVLQCKLYSSKVGNGAVQEIIAGMKFEDAHFGAVVSNMGFTPGARQLATKSGVDLLHHDEIEQWAAEILGTEEVGEEAEGEPPTPLRQIKGVEG